MVPTTSWIDRGWLGWAVKAQKHSKNSPRFRSQAFTPFGEMRAPLCLGLQWFSGNTNWRGKCVHLPRYRYNSLGKARINDELGAGSLKLCDSIAIHTRERIEWWVSQYSRVALPYIALESMKLPPKEISSCPTRRTIAKLSQS